MFNGNQYPVLIKKAAPKDTEDGRKIDLTLALLVPEGHFSDVADDLGDAVIVFGMNDDPRRGLDKLKYVAPLGRYDIQFAEQLTAFDEDKYTLTIKAVDLGGELVVERFADSEGVRFSASVKCEIDRTSKTAQYFLHDHHGHKVHCRMSLVEAPKQSGHMPQGKLYLSPKVRESVAAVNEFLDKTKNLEGIDSMTMTVINEDGSKSESVTIETDEYLTRLLCIGTCKAMAEAMPTFSFNDTGALKNYLDGMGRDPKHQLKHLRLQIKQLESGDIDLGKYTVSFGSQSVHVVENGTGRAVRTLGWPKLFEALTTNHISIGELEHVG